jgi:hypothetical protein
MRLRTAYIAISLLGMLCLVANIAAAIRPSFVAVMIAGSTFVMLIVAVPVALAAGVFSWRKTSRWWFLPPILCVIFAASPWIARPIGESYNDRQFKAHFEQYEAAINEIKKQDLPSSAAFTPIDLSRIKVPPGVIGIRAKRCANESVVVQFLVSAGGRIHKGYLFDGCEYAVLSTSPREKRYSLRHITGQWYHFSD